LKTVTKVKKSEKYAVLLWKRIHFNHLSFIR